MPSIETIKNSRIYKRLEVNAAGLIAQPAKLNQLVQEATVKAMNKQTGALKKIHGSLTASFRLLKAYARGEYKAVPKQSLIALVAAIAYFIMPFDVIPDFIAALGLFDDVALFGWVLASMKTDIEKFQQWEVEQIVEQVNDSKDDASI